MQPENLELNQIIKSPMNLALQLAELGKNTVSPNPMVGAVLVQNDRLVGYGYHLYKGDDHAEIKAIRMAGLSAKNSKLYLNLEPCCHHGLTAPCVDQIIKAGIIEVHFSSLDPNPIVHGKSTQALKQAGIKVFIGQLNEAAEQLNEIFYHYMKYKKPFVIAKWAMTMDGKIATANDSQWITSEKSREHVHTLRNSVDAILIGSRTAIQDNPILNVRIDNLVKIRQPLKFIIGSDLHALPKDLNIFKINPEKTHLINSDDNFDLNALLIKMADIGVTSLLIEGGGYTLSKFLQANLIDKFYCYIAPKFIGGEKSISPFSQDIGVNFIKDAKKAEVKKIELIGEDILIQGNFRRKKCLPE